MVKIMYQHVKYRNISAEAASGMEFTEKEASYDEQKTSSIGKKEALASDLIKGFLGMGG